MGDKPVPVMLKKLLTVDAAERWSCQDALESLGRATGKGTMMSLLSHPS